MDNLPSTVDLNAYKAYINEETIYSVTNKFLNSIDLKWESQSPPTLRIIVLNSIILNWHGKYQFQIIDSIRECT